MWVWELRRETKQYKEVVGMNLARPREYENEQKSTENTSAAISQKFCWPDWDFHVKSQWKLRLFLCLPVAPVQSLPPPAPSTDPPSCHPQKHFHRAPTYPCYQWGGHVHWQCSGTLTRPLKNPKVTQRLKSTSLKYLPRLHWKLRSHRTRFRSD